MSVFRGVRDQFVHKQGDGYRLIKRGFNSTFYGDVDGAVG